MSTPDSQEKLKEEAKTVRGMVEGLLKDKDATQRVVRTLCIYAGMITETLIEYEEPDVVMEQAFHRIAELLRTDPAGGAHDADLLPPAYQVDHDTEIGRQVCRASAKKLPKGTDDMHEVAIALIINDIPEWEKQGLRRDVMLRLLVEAVIASLTYEMATQDFCDLLIEEYMAEGGDGTGITAEAIMGLAAVAGYYFTRADMAVSLPPEAEQQLTNVMVRESVRHGTPGSRDWSMLASANDSENKHIPEYISKLKPQVDEFFVLIGLDDFMGRAVAVAKAVGRMVAVISVEDVGQIHPSIAKSLAKTGLILGSRYREGAPA